MGVDMLGTVPIILVISDTRVLWYPFVILHSCNEAKATGGRDKEREISNLVPTHQR